MNRDCVRCTIDGVDTVVSAHRTVAAVVTQEGSAPAIRRTRRGSAPRGLFCGIGACYDCLVHIDGQGPVRSCLVEVTEGMTITTMPSEGDHRA